MLPYRTYILATVCTAAWAAARFLHSGATYFFQLRSVGGAVADVAPDATAYAHRSANFAAAAFGPDRRRLDEEWDAMSAHFSGLYWSFETDRRPERLLDGYPAGTLRRLREVKCRYDPDGVFRDTWCSRRPNPSEIRPVRAACVRRGLARLTDCLTV